MISFESNALQFGLLLIFLVVYVVRPFAASIRENFSWVLAGLVLFALLAHVDFFRGDDARDRLQRTDLYHHHMGAKYFEELGYDGLYWASVVADFENRSGEYQGRALFRSLETHHLILRAEAVATSEAIKDRFSEERWTTFRNDIADFHAMSPEAWEEGGAYLGHGYEGTPLAATLYGGIANWLGWAPSTFDSWGTLGGILVLMLVATILGAILGAQTAWVFLFFWYVNPFNDYGLLGGGYFQNLDLMLLSLALATFVRGWRFLGGGLLAMATLLSPFYALFAAVVALRDLLAAQKREAFRENRWFYVVFLVMAVALVVATSVAAEPGTGFRWKDYATYIAGFEEQPGTFVTGAAAPIFLERPIVAQQNSANVPEGDMKGGVWSLARGVVTHREHHLVASGILAVLTLVFLRLAPSAVAVFAGIVFAYLLFPLSYSWYAVLAVVPIVFVGRNREVFFLTLTLLSVAGFSLFLDGDWQAPLKLLWGSGWLGALCFAVVLGGLGGWSSSADKGDVAPEAMKKDEGFAEEEETEEALEETEEDLDEPFDEPLEYEDEHEDISSLELEDYEEGTTPPVEVAMGESTDEPQSPPALEEQAPTDDDYMTPLAVDFPEESPPPEKNEGENGSR